MLLILLLFALRSASGAVSNSAELIAWLKPRIDVSCTMTFHGNDFVLEIGGKTLRDEAAVDAALSGKVALCRVKREATSTVALAAFATSMTYLRSKGTHRLEDKWGALLLREEYALRHGYAHWMWFGALNATDVAAPPSCHEVTSSVALGHVLKTLTVLAVLVACDGCDSVVYADVDSFPVQPNVKIESYIALAPSAHLIMSSQSGKPIVMNSGLFILRNCLWSRNFLAEWWSRRCGEKDQLALWETLFADWSQRAPSLLADPNLFRNYSYAHQNALPTLVSVRVATWPALSFEQWRCAPGTLCSKVLTASRCFAEPTLLPRVLVLPVAEFSDGQGGALPPMQSAGKLGLFCHKHCARGYNGSTYTAGCVGRLKELNFKPAVGIASSSQ